MIDREELYKEIETWTKDITFNSNDAVAYYNRGFAYSKLEEYDKAIEDFNKAIELEPEFEVTYIDAINMHIGMNEKNKKKYKVEIDDIIARGKENNSVKNDSSFIECVERFKDEEITETAEEKAERIIKEAEKKAERIIKEAREKRIIKEAEEKARKIIEKAEEKARKIEKEEEEKARLERGWDKLNPPEDEGVIKKIEKYKNN